MQHRADRGRNDALDCAAPPSLCGHYYAPVLAYLRKAGHDRDDSARDLAHDFFADLLSGGRLEHLVREQGRFRSYLLGALKHFLSHHRSRSRAQKRGGNSATFSLNETGIEQREGNALADKDHLPPDAWFDHMMRSFLPNSNNPPILRRSTTPILRSLVTSSADEERSTFDSHF
jgi:hypothetical protein